MPPVVIAIQCEECWPTASLCIAPRKPPGKGLWAALGPGLITGASEGPAVSPPIPGRARGLFSRCNRAHYPKPQLRVIVGPMLVANVINLGADLGAMGDAPTLLIDGAPHLYVVGFAVGCAAPETFSRYERCVVLLKWRPDLSVGRRRHRPGGGHTRGPGWRQTRSSQRSGWTPIMWLRL